MKKQVTTVLKESERLLISHPYDQGHDLDHHLAVIRTAKQISENIDQKIDMNALEIAVMWHDVMLKKSSGLGWRNRNKILPETLTYLDNLLTKLNFNDEFKRKVLDAIKYHEFSNKPVNIEGKVLYDADKLEVLNINRWKKIVKAVEDKKMSKIMLKIYIKIGALRLKKLKSKYHFDYSRKLHDQRVKEILNNKETLDLAMNFGLDLRKIFTEV